MKKIISVLVIVLFVVTSFTACSSGEKSEEAMKAEIKAELETEKKKEEELKEQIKKELEAEKASEPAKDNAKASKADMKDMDSIYEFVKQDIKGLSRDDFNLWEVNYLDITGDGTDEIVLAGIHGVEWPQKMQIISGDSGEYKRISSDIELYKYENKSEFKDGFFVVTGRTGGTGTESTEMNLYVYNGTEIVNVLSGLEVFYRVSAQGVDEEVIGEIDGKLTDFIFTVTKHDKMSGKKTIEKKEQYTYNNNTKKFDVKSIQVQKANDTPKSAGQPAKSSNAGTEEKENLKLSGLSNESINGTHVNYQDYCAVIVPMYNGVNSALLAEVIKGMGNVTQGSLSMRVKFAIFGHLKDIKITYYEGMDSNGEVLEVGTLYNANVDVQVYAQSGDMSYIKVTGKAPTESGNYSDVEFTLDDMRDSSDYEVIMRK
ncbi:MAG: hypothetical protein AB7G87_05730 [Clostridia bacterium]